MKSHEIPNKLSALGSDAGFGESCGHATGATTYRDKFPQQAALVDLAAELQCSAEPATTRVE